MTVMSGVEVAGIVLAVLPLFISAAEHYKGGIGIVKKAMKKELFAAQYKDELTQQKALLVMYIKGVIGRTNISPQTQLALINDPMGEFWKVPQVIKQISAELDEAYEPFLNAVSRICKVLSGQINVDSGSQSSDSDIVSLLSDSLKHSLTARRFNSCKDCAWITRKILPLDSTLR